jgi:hypothetical protein
MRLYQSMRKSKAIGLLRSMENSTDGISARELEQVDPKNRETKPIVPAEAE